MLSLKLDSRIPSLELLLAVTVNKASDAGAVNVRLIQTLSPDGNDPTV